MSKEKLEKGNLIDDEFTEKEMEVLYMFVDKGNRRKCYKEVFGKDVPSDKTIYRWFNKPKVQAKIIEIGQSLAIYDTVCDKTLLKIITDTNANNRDKINAIKAWNDLRQRVFTNIKLEHTEKLDLSNVTTDNLESIVEAITKANG